MITVTIPESIKEVEIFGRWGYDFPSQCLIVEYSIGGEINSHAFTKEETDSWTNDDDMIELLCAQKGFTRNTI